MRIHGTEPDTPAPDDELAGLTQLLVELRHGDRAVLDEAVARMYRHLRRLAAAQLGRERPGHTLRPTGLVNEAYLRLADTAGLAVADRSHFMAVAARAMRQVLVDHARQRRALKRGGDLARTTLDGKDVAQPDADERVLAIDAALEALGGCDSRARTIVEHRFFLGLTEVETADLLGVSARTVRREWVRARAWLHQHIAGGAPEA